MQSIPLRLANVSRLPLATCVGATVALLTTCPAQANVAPPGNGAAPAEPQRDPRFDGLPTFLLPVPGGTVRLGITAEELVDAACQTAFPPRPEKAMEASAKAVGIAMRRSASLLGPQKVTVEPFLLAKWPVKCSEYEVFVALSRKEGTTLDPVLPPFGWWRYGCKEDYDKRLPEVNQMFPKDPDGPEHYWRLKGHELPYKLQDEFGNSIADHPVGYITYGEANRFAAWLGMRLPHESEWTRAARGDGTHNWPWGAKDPALDKFQGDKSLKVIQLANANQKKRKPVGTVDTAAGPFGHVDMFGSIWQLVADVGYYPINGAEPFAAEWKQLQRDKDASQLLEFPPAWVDVRVCTKGGSYLSGDDPIQLMVDQRAPVRTDEALESVGFRLAKSLRPGYDTLYSLLRGVYNRAPFLPDQQPVLEEQIGTERYEIGANGFPTGYNTVSFAPTNWLSKGKSIDLRKLFESSYRNPLVLGTLVLTEKIDGVDTQHGQIFTVLYRAEGQPRELEDAIKVGHREVQAELKAAEQAKKAGLKPKEGEEEEETDDKDKKDDWRAVLARYGLSPTDLEPKEAKKGLDFVRVDGIEVKTDRAAFLLHGNDGKIIVAIPAPNAKPSASAAFAATLELEGNGDGKSVAKFHFGVPFVDSNNKRVVDFTFHLPLDRAAPTPEKPWR